MIQVAQPPAAVAAGRIGGTVSEMQLDQALLDEQPLPRGAVWDALGLMTFIAAAVTWACWAEVDREVPGKVRLMPVVSKTTVVTHSAGTLERINVRVGEVVRKGSELAALDPTVSQADVKQHAQKLETLTTELSRLTAELNQQPYVPAVRSEASALQSRIIEDRRREYAARLEGHDHAVKRAQAALVRNEADTKRLELQLAIVQEKYAIDQRLEQASVPSISRLQVLQSQHEFERSRAAAAASGDARAELEEDLEAKRAEREAFTAGWVRQAREQFATVKLEVDRLRQELTKAAHLDGRRILRAPMDAVVLEVAAKAVGSAVRENESLVTLVPWGVALEAEIEVTAADVGMLQEQNDVRLRLDAYPYHRHGELLGQIAVISRDAAVPVTRSDDEAKKPPTVFLVKARVVANHLHDMPEAYQAALIDAGEQAGPTAGLRPGSTGTAHVKVGRRRVIGYFLGALWEGLEESLREPQ